MVVGMGLTLQLRYPSAADLRAHLFENTERGALLLPMAEPPRDLKQYAPVALEVVVDEDRCVMSAEVLQVLPGTGLVVRLTDVNEATGLVESAPIAEPALPPEVRLSLPEQDLGAAPEPVPDDAPARGGTKPRIGPQIAGSSPVSWSIEQLQATWDQLTVPEKVRVARHGKRPARMLILKGLDKTLHVHVLHNTGVTPEEVTMMAGMSSLDPTVLRRIAGDTQWLRHTSVARNLICNPKLTLVQITKILKYLPRDELSRLARTGKVRQSVKQLIVKTLDRTR
jgi:hypothetical protein